MDFGAKKTRVKVIKEVLLEELSETFILILMVNGIKCHEKNLMS